MSISEPGNLSGLMREFEHKTPHPIAGADALTAAIEMTKDKLGIVDKPERSISDPTVQRDGLWKYDATSNNPLLDHLVNFLALEKNVLGETNDSYKEYLALLHQDLPDTIKARIEYESTLPFQSRDPDYQEFQNALVFTAVTLAWLDSVTKLHEPNDLELARKLISSELPVIALKTSLQDTSSILESAKDYLLFVGPNNPNFDKLNNYITQIGVAHTKVAAFADKISSSEISESDLATLKKLSSELTVLKQVIQHTDIGNELRILDPTIASLSAMASALSLNQGSATLAIGLLMVNSHLSQNASSLGILGDGLLTTNAVLSQSIAENLISPNRNDSGSNVFFTNATNTILLSVAAATTSLAENGFGILPESANQNHSFTLQLALNIVSSSRFFETVFENLAKATGASDQNAKSISQIYTTTALFLSALIGSKGHEDLLKNLILSIDSDFNKGIDYIESYVDQQINNEKIQSDLGNTLHAYLLQAKSSLENEDINGFIQAYSGVLNSLNLSENDINQEIKTISDFTHTLTNALKENNETEFNAYGGYMQS